MAKIQYSKKLRRLQSKLAALSQRIGAAYQAAPDEIISTPFDGCGINIDPANTTRAENPVSLVPPQAAPLPSDSPAAPAGCAPHRSQSAPQSEYERRLPIRHEQVKRFAAKRQLEVLELRAHALHQSSNFLIRGAFAGVRRTTVTY